MEIKAEQITIRKLTFVLISVITAIKLLLPKFDLIFIKFYQNFVGNYNLHCIVVSNLPERFFETINRRFEIVLFCFLSIVVLNFLKKQPNLLILFSCFVSLVWHIFESIGILMQGNCTVSLKPLIYPTLFSFILLISQLFEIIYHNNSEKLS